MNLRELHDIRAVVYDGNVGAYRQAGAYGQQRREGEDRTEKRRPHARPAGQSNRRADTSARS